MVCQFCGRELPAVDVQEPDEPEDDLEHSLGWSAYALIGLFIALLALVCFGTLSSTQAFQSILSTNPRLTLTERLVSLTRVSTPTPEPPCFGWYQITTDMRGQHVCVYGMVLEYKEDWASQRTYIYFGSKEEFYLVSDYRWSAAIEDTCITVEGTVELNTHETPYIEVIDIHDCK